MDIIIGSHVSFNKDTQLLGSAMEAYEYGGNTFMFYTGAPQNTRRLPISDAKTFEAYQFMETHGIDPRQVIVHAPYIINLANTEKEDSYEFAMNFLEQEIERCEQLGILRLVLHPGSSVKLTKEEGIQNIIHGLNHVLKKDQSVFILLETMAGKGTEIGRSFEEIKQIIDGVRLSEKLMVCLDTCHIHDAGYDVTKFDKLLDDFDRVIGLEKLGCIHINDSKNIKGAHKDRHANFGFGEIGFDTLLKIVYHKRLKGVPKILETPFVGNTETDKNRLYPPYRFEIDMIKNQKFNPDLLWDIRNYYRKD